MKPIRTQLAHLSLVIGLGACVAPGPRVTPSSRSSLPVLFASAFRADAEGDADRAIRAYVDVVREAARAPNDPWQIAAVAASLDALVTRTMPAFGEFGDDAALAQRSNAPVFEPLAKTAHDATGPLVRGLIARALTRYSERRGDITRADTWRAASGCVREALVVGPLSNRLATGIEGAGPLDAFDAPIPAAFPTDTAVLAPVAPRGVRGRGCAIPLSVANTQPGVREVVVDVEVPRDGTIGIALRARGAAWLRAGGVPAPPRDFSVVGGERTLYATVTAPAGVLRLVARVGAEREDDWVELDAWADDGAPLRTIMPANRRGCHLTRNGDSMERYPRGREHA